MTDSPADADDFLEFANLFLDENANLFTIIGIFGAISVYLGTITTELSASYLDIALDVGVFASLLLFVLVGVLINERFKDEYDEFRGSILLYPQRENIIPVMSLVLFDGLLGSVFFLVIAAFHESWVTLLSLTLAGLLSYATIFFPPYLAYRIENSGRFPFEDTLYWTTIFLTFLHLTTWASVRNFLYFNLSQEYYQIVSTSIMAIGGSLLFLLFFTLRYEVGTPWS